MFNPAAMRLAGAMVAGAALLVAGASAAAEADVTGKWSGDVVLPTGQTLPFAAEFKQEGMALTGKLAGVNGAPDVTIENGMVHGEFVTFTGTGAGQGGPMKFSYTGKVAAPDVIDFEMVPADAKGAPLKARATKAN